MFQATDIQIADVRAVRAAEVDRLGRDFVDAVARVHPQCRSLYMHFAGSGHMGRQIIQHGDIKAYGMDGLEAKHSTTKDIMRRLTNSKIYQRIQTVMSHYCLREHVTSAAVVCLYHLRLPI